MLAYDETAWLKGEREVDACRPPVRKGWLPMPLSTEELTALPPTGWGMCCTKLKVVCSWSPLPRVSIMKSPPVNRPFELGGRIRSTEGCGLMVVRDQEADLSELDTQDIEGAGVGLSRSPRLGRRSGRPACRAGCRARC